MKSVSFLLALILFYNYSNAQIEIVPIFFSKKINYVPKFNAISVYEHKKKRLIKEDFQGLKIEISPSEYKIDCEPYKSFSGKINNIKSFVSPKGLIGFEFTAANYDYTKVAKTEVVMSDSSFINLRTLIYSKGNYEEEFIEMSYYLDLVTFKNSFHYEIPSIDSLTFVRLKKIKTYINSKKQQATKEIYSGLKESVISLDRKRLYVNIQDEGELVNIDWNKMCYWYNIDDGYDMQESFFVFTPSEDKFLAIQKINSKIENIVLNYGASFLYTFSDVLPQQPVVKDKNPLISKFSEQELSKMAVVKLDSYVDLDEIASILNMDRRQLGRWNFDYLLRVEDFRNGITSSILIRIPKDKLELFLEKKSQLVKKTSIPVYFD